MELMFSLCVFLVFIFMLHKIFKRNPSFNLPPGPKPLPIIGNLHQLVSGDLLHHVLRDLSKEHGPLMHLKFGQIPTIVITSPEMAMEIFKTHDKLFSQRPRNSIVFKLFSYNFSDIVFSPYGNYWKAIRKIFMLELLNSKRVQSFQSIREEEVLRFIKSIFSDSEKGQGKTVNVSEKIFSFTYSITSRAAFGEISNKTRSNFVKLITEINQLGGKINVSDLYPSLKFLEMTSGVKRGMENAMRQADEILQGILNEHKEKKTLEKSSSDDQKKFDDDNDNDNDDIVDVFLRIQKNGDFGISLTDTNLKAVLFNIFAGGSETSSTTLEWALSEILKNPRILKKAQEEVRNQYNVRGNVDESNLGDLKYLQAIVKETHRLHPSTPLLFPRENKEECKINGYDIPAKTRVFVNFWAIGRDPKFWPDQPETFKPERFIDSDEIIDFRGNHFQYIPFGAGRRICPGINFAQSNILLPLAQLLFHFDWKLSGDRNLEELDMEETMAISVRRKSDLKLVPIPYSGSSVLMVD